MIFNSYIINFLLKHKALSTFVGLIFVILIAYFFQAIRKIMLINGCHYNVDEPIDVVYTWVNGSDQQFLNNLQTFLTCNNSFQTDLSLQRFDDKYELKFSLRSLEKFAPWVRHVYIVTNGQIPYWLNLDCDKVTLVSHQDIFIDSKHLPTFSSPAIESNLHRIPGLSDRFIYFNDDVFLGDSIFPDDFYSPNNGFIVYLSWPIPMCAEDCPWVYVGDKECDLPCLNDECQMDGGDCDFGSELSRATFEPFFIENWDVFETNANENSNKTHTVGNKSTIPLPVVKLEFEPKKIVNNSISEVAEVVRKHNRKVLQNDRLKRKRRNIKEKFAQLKKPELQKSSGKSCPSREDSRIDTYRASLQHTNRILNLKYGFLSRYTPAHAPILIDRKIMENLQETFPIEFEKTSANRVRRGDDMQFSLSYYYFLIHENRKRDIEEIFDVFDTDNSGTWSDREIRTILTRLYELPLTYQMVDQFENLILNCTFRGNGFHYDDVIVTPEFERYVDSKLPTVSKQLIASCETMSEILIKKFGTVKKYKHKIIKHSQDKYVTFKMLTSNVSQVVGHLDEIRREPKKFVCLNDNMDNYSESENEMVRAILYDFYLSLFPNPSRFELPNDLRNRFVYIDELRVWKSYHRKLRIFIYLCFVLLLYITCQNFCKRRILYRCLNKLLQ
ncbi:N-acetylglucosamine-1-phosphotransferase subunits alpha/beta [Agrilus planipennis]|uniref:N-acetylglucosamine-1-phosphotransferase subunits alpha/beta n=1 Tax=Agrilus planipennis TaxID=224129 RepID=A0A1W4WTU4_AGRPL|nr:N-acetylglucosamine-1-phosphotransferase subunits alpha/beta [Agrilus planipennis]